MPRSCLAVAVIAALAMLPADASAQSSMAMSPAAQARIGDLTHKSTARRPRKHATKGGKAGSAMMKKDVGMMKKDDGMMKKDAPKMKKGDAMMKKPE